MKFKNWKKFTKKFEKSEENLVLNLLSTEF